MSKPAAARPRAALSWSVLLALLAGLLVVGPLRPAAAEGSPPDADGDGVADIADNCVHEANPDQTDSDDDGAGNACDDERDGDEVPDAQDNCADVPNADQVDTDGDEAGNACDDDDDGDSVPDVNDLCPYEVGGGDGCPVPDGDGDGVPDDLDLCPADPGTTDDGCPLEQIIRTPGNPISEVQVGRDLQCAVFRFRDAGNPMDQVFYGDRACGTFLAVGNRLFGPDYVPAGSSAGPREVWTSLRQSPVSGNGSAAHPFTIETVVAAGDTGIEVTQRDTYVLGEARTSTEIAVTNTTATAGDVIVWRAGDCYFQGSDDGFGTVQRDSNAVGCREGVPDQHGNDVPGPLVLEWEPLAAGSRYYEAGYDEVWQLIGERQPYPNTCVCPDYMDNGAGLSWTLSIPPTAITAVGHRLNVVERPIQRGEIRGDTDGDGRADDADNCPGVSNSDQADSDHDGTGDACETPPAPAITTNPAPATTARTIAIGWTYPADGTPVSHFVVARGVAFSNSYAQEQVEAAARTSLHNVPPGTSWTYFVRACNGQFCSDWSNAVTATATAPPPPAAPANLHILATTASSIRVGWDHAGTAVDRFELARGVAFSNAYEFLDRDADDREYTHRNLTGNSSWTYFVRACNASGCSSWSNAVTGTATVPRADLGVRVTGPAIAVGGARYTYKVVVTNAGPDSAADVTVSAPLPTEVSYAGMSGLLYLANGSSTTSGHGCSANLAARIASCRFSAIASGRSAEMSVTVQPAATTPLLLSGSAGAAGSTDPNSGNNSATLGVNGQGTPRPPALRVGGQTPTGVTLAWDNYSGNNTEFVVAYAAAGSGSYSSESLPATRVCSAITTACTWSQTLDAGTQRTYFLRACLSGACSDWSNAVTAGPVPAARLRALEVNQAVQNWQNSLTVVAGKATVVRAFVESTDGRTLTLGGRLHGSRGGNPLPGSPLSPFNASGQTSVRPDIAARRGVLADSLNFRLPASWVEGQVTLRFELPGGTAIPCSDAALPTANDCATTVSFRTGQTPDIKFVSVPWRTATTAYAAPTTADLTEQADRVQSSFPIPAINRSFGSLASITSTATNISNAVNNQLATMRVNDGCSQRSAACNDRLYYGVVNGPVGGLANGIPGTVSSGSQSTASDAYARNRGPHEIAHTLGEHHTADNPRRPVTVSGQSISGGVCSELADLTAPVYPHVNSVDGTRRATLGPLGTEATEVWGLDNRYAETDASLAVVDPRVVWALMSYCQPNSGQGRWMTQTNWENIFGRGFTGVSEIAGATVSDALADLGVPTDFMVVRGTIDLEATPPTVTFEPFGQITTAELPQPPLAGDYTLELLDAAGNVIPGSPVSFAPGESHADAGPDPSAAVPRTTTFAIPLMDPGVPVEAVRLRLGADVVGEAVRTSNAPAVGILAPVPVSAEPFEAAAVLGEELAVRWTATDADPLDTLVATVAYSPDGGVTWSTLGVDLTGGELLVPRAQLPGSTDARIRVTVSDGFLSTTATSEPFVVGDSAPQVTLGGPAQQDATGDQAVLLAADAFDVGDGTLEESAFTWTSSLDGHLGSGRALSLSALDLSAGQHTITVTAADSASNVGAAALRLSVFRSALAAPTADGTGGGDGGAQPKPAPSPSPEPGEGPSEGPNPGPDPAPQPVPGDGQGKLGVLAGPDRVASSVAVSRARYQDARGAGLASGRIRAGAVVVAHAGDYPDALVGTPLAAAHSAPLLLTGRDSLDAGVAAEIRRVLADGMTVYLLGGEAALAAAVETAIAELGMRTVRYRGPTRYDTAVAVAEALGAPGDVLLATGENYPDALAAGAAAAAVEGVVLLTAGTALPEATAGYLQAHPGLRWAVGGPAASAAPQAQAIRGGDRFATAAAVADRFFRAPPMVGVASGGGFADALAGGAHAASLGGPLLLTLPDAVPEPVSAYLRARNASIDTVFVYGGEAAVGAAVRTAVLAAVR